MSRTNNPETDVRIKTFQIQNTSDEDAMNAFLSGKMVRYWEANFSPGSALPSTDGSPLVLGVWNIFVAYQEREAEGRGHDQQNRHGRQAPQIQKRNAPVHQTQAVAEEKRSEARKPVETYKPQVSEQDFPLFESIRTWRNSRAREERVKPFSFFNNRQLEQIVTSKPADAPTLKDIASDMEPQLWEKYHKELLGFIDAARSVQGSTHRTPEAIETEPASIPAAEVESV